MGMAASQSRYILVTGKKSDVEFQGQQINQQRTTLATQTSAYNTQLLNLVVPTPPSVSDYTTTTYSFSKDGEACTVKSAQYQATGYNEDPTNLTQPFKYDAGTYIVNFTTNTTADVGKTSGTSLVTNTNGVFRIGSQVLDPVDLSKYPADDDQTAEFAKLQTIVKDCNLGISDADLLTSTTTNPQFYKYTSNVNNKQVTKYLTADDLQQINNGDSAAVSKYYLDEGANVTENEQLYGAKITWSDTGRMSQITTNDGNGNEITYTLDTETTKDEDAYNDAYNEYTFNKDKYEQEMDNINAKIEIIQTQDRKLELKLKDLDTQQEALSTEMDSLKKVIDKNIEASFKAFA